MKLSLLVYGYLFIRITINLVKAFLPFIKILVLSKFRKYYQMNLTRKERTMETSLSLLSTEQKVALVQKMKESQEWANFLTEVEKVIIRVLTDDKKQVWYLEMAEICIDIVAECSDELKLAIEDTKNVPEEWKNATWPERIKFILDVMIATGMLIVGIWIKPQEPAPSAWSAPSV